MKDLVPSALSRRLVLNLLGWRMVDGRWWLGHAQVTEEQLDTMPERRWRAFLRTWLSSAATH